MGTVGGARDGGETEQQCSASDGSSHTDPSDHHVHVLSVKEQEEGDLRADTDKVIKMSTFDLSEEHQDPECEDDAGTPPPDDPSGHEGMAWEISFEDEQKPKRPMPKFLQRERTSRTEQLKKDILPLKTSSAKSPRTRVTPERASKPSYSAPPPARLAKSPGAKATASEKQKKVPAKRFSLSPQKFTRAQEHKPEPPRTTSSPLQSSRPLKSRPASAPPAPQDGRKSRPGSSSPRSSLSASSSALPRRLFSRGPKSDTTLKEEPRSEQSKNKSLASGSSSALPQRLFSRSPKSKTIPKDTGIEQSKAPLPDPARQTLLESLDEIGKRTEAVVGDHGGHTDVSTSRSQLESFSFKSSEDSERASSETKESEGCGGLVWTVNLSDIQPKTSLGGTKQQPKKPTTKSSPGVKPAQTRGLMKMTLPSMWKRPGTAPIPAKTPEDMAKRKVLDLRRWSVTGCFLHQRSSHTLSGF